MQDKVTPMRLPCFLVLLFAFGVSVWASEPSSQFSITIDSQQSQSKVLLDDVPQLSSFAIDAWIDPSTTEGGNVQAVAGITLGFSAKQEAGDPRKIKGADNGLESVTLELREGSGRGSWFVWIDGANKTNERPDPEPPGWAGYSPQYQHPNEFLQVDGAYRVRIAVAPEGDGSRLRFFFRFLDRPVAEYTTETPVTLGRVIGYAAMGGQNLKSHTSTVAADAPQRIEPEVALANPPIWESVMDAVDLTRSDMRAVAKAIEEGNDKRARTLFINHMRNRKRPRGPSWEEVASHSLHPDYRKIAGEVLKNSYGRQGYFTDFATEWTDAAGETHSWVLPDGKINWARCNGHLNRHFHWVSLAKSYSETNDSAYAKRFAREVTDWVTREPFFWDRCPSVGGINLMDGTVFVAGYMNTSNIGRRCELTWWPAYQVFRSAREFDEEAHFAMLMGFLRQSRLLMNPTSFAAHDDGGSHGAMALLNNALMLPEFAESKDWMAEALRRWDEILKVQFYPDGSHVSGSTGYNWASLLSLENFIRVCRREKMELPERFLSTLEKGLEHTIGISRPDQGQIDMNDGGWGHVNDHFTRVIDLFPHRSDFRWMATRGRSGNPPEFVSKYYPHAGHVAMRSGWGPRERYLFMDVGPLGASHGKNDKLNIYLALGPHQLISSGGRGSYDANPFSGYASSTRSYNTVLVDDGLQQRVHLKHTHTGHITEQRRWKNNDSFDYAEGVYQSGWYTPDKRTTGRHTRQTLFIKGRQPDREGYFIVIDTVEPDDDQMHQYKALFHSRRNEAKLHPEKRIFEGHDTAAKYAIIPADPRDLELRDVRGQTEPYLQGWHVVGTNHAPMHTAVYSWKAKGTTTRAWILVPALAGESYCVDDVELQENDSGLMIATIMLPRGRRDILVRRPQSEAGTPIEVAGQSIDSDVTLLRLGPGDRLIERVEI